MKAVIAALLLLLVGFVVATPRPAYADYTMQEFVEKARGESDDARCRRVLAESIKKVRGDQYTAEETLDSAFSLGAGIGGDLGIIKSEWQAAWEGAVSSRGFVNLPGDSVSVAYYARGGRFGLVDDMHKDGNLWLDGAGFVVFGGHSHDIGAYYHVVEKQTYESSDTRTTVTKSCAAALSRRETGGFSLGATFDTVSRQPGVALGATRLTSRRSNGFANASGQISFAHLVVYPPLPHFGLAYDMRFTGGPEEGLGLGMGMTMRFGALHDGDRLNLFMAMSLDLAAMWTNPL